MKAILVKSNNDVDVVDLNNDRNKTLSDLQKFLGGHVERVVPKPIPHRFAMYVDEEAAMAGRPIKKPNVFASNFYGGYIFGDVVIAKETDTMEGLTIKTMSEEEITHWLWWIRSWMRRI